MTTPNLIAIAVFALLNFEQPETAFIVDTSQLDRPDQHYYVSYFDSSTPLHLVFSAGWSTTNNDYGPDRQVHDRTTATIFAPRVTFTNGYYIIEFQE